MGQSPNRGVIARAAARRHVVRMTRLVLLLAVAFGGCAHPALYQPVVVARSSGGSCECRAPRVLVERELTASEIEKLGGPTPLASRVAVYRARQRGEDPDASDECSWGRDAYVLGDDHDTLVAALDSAGVSSSAVPVDGRWLSSRRVGVALVSELAGSPAVTGFGALREECAHLH